MLKVSELLAKTHVIEKCKQEGIQNNKRLKKARKLFSYVDLTELESNKKKH